MAALEIVLFVFNILFNLIASLQYILAFQAFW
jgi:hypothetical protein